MTNDLVRRLREEQPVTQDMESTVHCELQDEAADRIADLEAKLMRAIGHKEDYAAAFVRAAEELQQQGDRIAELEAKLAKAVELLEWQTRLVDNNITPNSETTHRINIAGTWYTGPVVDWTQSVLTSWKKTNRVTLAELKGERKCTS